MASGDFIKWSNFSHSAARDTYAVGGKGWNGTGYMYISAPAFEVRLHVVGAFASTAELLCRFDYYNWSNNSWVTGTSITASARGANATDNKYYYHNWNGSNTDNDSRQYIHFWRVYVHTVNSGGQRHIEADFTVGGVGCMSETQYNSICMNPSTGIGRYIVSAGRLSGDWIHWTDQNPNDSQALELFNWSANSGTMISDSLANKVIPLSWV